MNVLIKLIRESTSKKETDSKQEKASIFCVDAGVGFYMISAITSLPLTHHKSELIFCVTSIRNIHI